MNKRRKPLNRLVLVLNRNWFPVSITTVRRALTSVFRGSALIIEPESYMALEFEEWAGLSVTEDEDFIATSSVKIKIPEIIIMQSYGGTFTKRVKLSKRSLLARDNYTCQLCQSKPPVRATIDHVIPKSKGGRTSWTNCVIACRKCNEKKGNKTPQELGLNIEVAARHNTRHPVLSLVHPNQRVKSWDKFIR